MQDSIPTEELVQAAAAGDASAFNELIERFGERLRATVSTRIGGHLQAKLDPEDVVQETFAKALRALAGFEWRGEDAFLRWLRAISENVVLRTAGRRRAERHFEIDRRHAGMEQELTTASKQLRRGERFDRLENALSSLRADHREVILLARIEGLQLKEVAGRMSRSVSAVQNLLLRALKELKRSFGDTQSLNLPDRQLGGQRDVE